MSKMPELFDTADALRQELDHADKTVLYSTAGAALWMVKHEDMETLRLGEAVKITKWEEGISLVPVKREQDRMTRQWGWLEVGSPISVQPLF